MEFVEHEVEETLRREEAARRLRDLADEISRHNGVQFEQGGVRFTVDVPDQVRLKLEIEVKDDKGEIEVKLKW